MSIAEHIKGEAAEKVRKLLTQAEDPAATPEEAQAFTMKAQQLMTKYAIDLAMIADAVDVDQLVARSWDLHGPYAGQKVSIVNAVAQANDCRAIYANLPQGRKHIEVIGYASDVGWVRTLSGSLEIQMAAALAGAIRTKPRDVHGRTFAVGFVMGFVGEVHGRLRRARREAVAAAEAARVARVAEETARHELAGGPPVQPSRSVALVLVAKGERVDDEFKVRHPHTSSVSRQVRLRSWSGYEPGRAAGRKAAIARGSIGGRQSLSA
ncbi:MAG: DUF2786 domain-containing protein [Acidimicrobiales bacterium]